MHKDWILFHLREAHEELTRTMRVIETDTRFDESELQVAVGHAYHHLNTAWNSRNVEAPGAGHSEQEFYEWRQFPADVPLGDVHRG